MPQTYNGYTNYETWNFKFWLDNEEATYYYFRNRCQELANETEDRDGAISALVYDLKEYAEENAPDLPPSCYKDLLMNALQRINFDEVATAIYDDNSK